MQHTLWDIRQHVLDVRQNSFDLQGNLRDIHQSLSALVNKLQDDDVTLLSLDDEVYQEDDQRFWSSNNFWGGCRGSFVGRPTSTRVARGMGWALHMESSGYSMQNLGGFWLLLPLLCTANQACGPILSTCNPHASEYFTTCCSSPAVSRHISRVWPKQNHP